jgi:hypothetical protein
LFVLLLEGKVKNPSSENQKIHLGGRESFKKNLLVLLGLLAYVKATLPLFEGKKNPPSF